MLDNSSADPSEDEGCDPDLPESGSDDEAAAGSSSQWRRNVGDTRTYREKLLARQEAWDVDRPAKTEKLRAAAAWLPESVDMKRDSMRSCMQLCIELALGKHCCCQHAHAKLETVSSRSVMYLQMGHAVPVQVPTVQCSLCHEVWEVSACDVHCFPSTPVSVEFWVDVQLLQFFHQCAIKGGVSGTVFAAAAASVRAATDADPVPFSARYV